MQTRHRGKLNLFWYYFWLVWGQKDLLKMWAKFHSSKSPNIYSSWIWPCLNIHTCNSTHSRTQKYAYTHIYILHIYVWSTSFFLEFTYTLILHHTMCHNSYAELNIRRYKWNICNDLLVFGVHNRTLECTYFPTSISKYTIHFGVKC